MAIRYDQIELSSSSFHDKPTIQAKGGSSMVRINSNYGYIEIGPENNSHCHIQTDKSNFYFNKEIQVNSGIISSYDEDLDLRRAGTSKITAGVNNIYIKEGVRIQENWGQGDYGAEQLTIIGSYPSITLRNNAVDHKWLIHHDGNGKALQFYEGNDWDSTSWSRRFGLHNEGWFEITKTSGTMIRTGASSDAFGYNSNYGHYIAGNGGTYVYGNGSVYDGTANRTILHTGNYGSYVYSESESDARFTSKDHFRSTGTGYYSSTTTSALLSEALGDGAFNSYLTAHKTGWSYAGNGDLTDAGRLTELAGTSWLWWTDNSTDGQQGNVTALCIAPNTGGSANKVFIYNNQGSGYAPGWREVWTNKSDGSGSGLDADLLDGLQGSQFLRSDTSDTMSGTLTTASLSVTGNTNLGNGNGDVTRVNDILHVMSSDSGDSYFRFGEDSGGDYGSEWYWDSGLTFYWYSRDNGSNRELMRFNVRYGNDPYIHWNRHFHIHNYDINYVNQLHFNDNVRFYDQGNDSYLVFKYGDATTGGIRFLNGGGTQKGYLYANDSGFGLLSADGSWAFRSTDGGSEIYHDVKCPIYYDSDNTAYYANPNSTSNFSRLDLQAYSFFNAGLQVKRDIGTTSPSWQDSSHTLSLENGDAGYISINFHRSGYTSNNIYYTGSEIITDDTFRSTVDMRAPIFYDSNDTNYYGNFNGDSRINRIFYTKIESPSSSNNARLQNHSSWGTLHQTDHGYIQLGPANTGHAHIYTDRSNFYFNKVLYVNGGTQLNTNDVRSKIFYDIDNTGYYLNPASTSNLNVVQAKSIRNDGSVTSDDGFGIYWQNNADTGYAIYREPGGWSNPYPDLRIAFHTGIKLGAHKNYNGIRFYNNSDMATITASIGDGDDNMRSYYDIIAYASDKRLKTNIEPITNAVDKVKSLQGMTYNWNEVGKEYGWEPSKEREVGVFAQDVEAVLPEAVKLAPFDQDHDTEGNMYSKSGENFLTVKYEKIVPLLIEAIKDQQKQIDELKSLINKS